MTNVGTVEKFWGGFSNSALAMRRLLDVVQAYGIYLTDKRLIVTKEKSSSKLAWRFNAGARFGTVTSEVKPFFDASARTVKKLDGAYKKLDVSLDEVVQIELKHPSFFFKGHVKISLKSGKTVKVLVLDTTQECSKRCFEVAKELFQTHLPEKVKEA